MLFEADTLAGLSDGQLLERFIARREGAALEALVQRHGPMVWGVCRRVLRDHHDAEDAFQATFLVLARRAASILPREKVGNWLYGVAYQTARKARAMKARRRTREGQAQNAPEPEAVSRVQRSELAELLDHEVSRLPAKYRTPIVLCELEGKTHAEAAQRLGWPIGTVSGRLSRAKAMLAKRLIRQGVSISGVSLALLLAQNQDALSASVPTLLLSSTQKAAMLFAAGGAVSSQAAALAKEVLKTMLLSKIKITTAITTAALLAFSLSGAGLWQASSWADAEALPEATFRVTVNEVLHDDSTVVTQIDIETPPGSTVELRSNKDKRGNLSLSSDANNSKRPGERSHVQLVILADQVEWKESSTSAVKFVLGYKFGSSSGSFSEARPMPADARQLTDLLTMSIKSGEYKYELPVKVVTYKGATYSVVVSRPK
jgi:RNA polymerase sigma factor (sigma-70 family)